MPSPLPGMDPCLESPDWFPELHDRMIFSIKERLQALLPKSYYARSRQRVWLGLEHRDHVEPDVDVLRSGGTKPRRRRRDTDAGGVAVAEPVMSGPVVVRVGRIMGDPQHEPFLEIHRRQGPDDVVVAIVEILSPSHKTRGDHGRNLYLAKQQETLFS